MIDIEKYIGLLKDVGDMQIAIKDRLNNIIKKYCETNPQKTLENKVQEYGKELSALKRPTQKTLTCPHCGKRTSLNLFWGYRCEHCHSDVTPKTKATKIQKLEEKIATMRKKIDELELKRRTKKFVVKYAVKVEVHC